MPAPRRHYAWTVLGLCFLAILCAQGVRLSFGAFVRPWEDAFDASRGTITLIGSLSFQRRQYADATHVTVRLARECREVLLEIVDDGIGGADVANGSGLRGLVDRVEELDGRVELVSPPGGGTRVRAAFPAA